MKIEIELEEVWDQLDAVLLRIRELENQVKEIPKLKDEISRLNYNERHAPTGGHGTI
jgi:chaperonin cofactor prefoldin